MKKTQKAFLFIVCKILIIAAIVFVIVNWIVAIRICRTTDMYPNIRDGDMVLLLRTQNVTFDDIILYQVDGVDHYGRIVAVAGETVVIDQESGLVVNDNIVYNTLPYETKPEDGNELEVVVPEGSVYVLGDCRIQCSDSRKFGCIEKSMVIGKQVYLMRWRGF